MRKGILEILSCPNCKNEVLKTIVDPKLGLTKSLICEKCGTQYFRDKYDAIDFSPCEVMKDKDDKRKYEKFKKILGFFRGGIPREIFGL